MEEKELLLKMNKIADNILPAKDVYVRYSEYPKNISVEIPDDAEKTARKVFFYKNIITGEIVFSKPDAYIIDGQRKMYRLDIQYFGDIEVSVFSFF